MWNEIRTPEIKPFGEMTGEEKMDEYVAHNCAGPCGCGFCKLYEAEHKKTNQK